MTIYNLNKDTIHNLYWNKIMTLDEIGEHFGCCGTTIGNFMRKHNIPRKIAKARNPQCTSSRRKNISQAHHRPIGSLRLSRHGYIEIKVSLEYSRPLQKKNWTRRSRYIMEQHLGRPFKKNEVVHHINGNKTDDRIENLSLHLRGEHDFISSLSRERDKLGRFI